MRLLSLLLVFLLTAAAGAQQSSMSTAVVPVVGSVIGATHVQWKTDLEVLNDTGGAVTVALELVAVPGAAIILDLAPGATERFSDIIGQAFGLELALSPLRVTTSGRRSVTVKATAYALGATGISKPQPLATMYRTDYSPFRALDGLGFADDRRTNLGLVNLGDHEAHFILALQRLPGRDIGIAHVRLEPESLLHIPIQFLFPLMSKGEHFRIVVETTARDTYCYASVIDNEHTGVFISPRSSSR